jgi:hypothetical protein
MKINILLLTVFLSFTLLAYSGLFEIPDRRIGGTQLNGDGCVCHSLDEDPDVIVWVEGPETLAVGQSGIYKMFLAGGPAEAGGYNVAGRFGIMGLVDTLSVWDYREPNELTQAFPLVFPTPEDTIFWPFEYFASDSSEVDTIYSVGLSIVYDSIPDFHDRWAFGPKFPLTIIRTGPPVIVSTIPENDTTVVVNSVVTFFVEAEDTTQLPLSYGWMLNSFDVDEPGSIYQYTAEQFPQVPRVDTITVAITNGYFYSTKTWLVNVEQATGINEENNRILSFHLEQNYPNPFNPSTKISYSIPEDGEVTLKVYNVTGNEIVTLVNKPQSAGSYQVSFDGSEFSSGIYFYSLEADGVRLVRKMVLIK